MNIDKHNREIKQRKISIFIFPKKAEWLIYIEVLGGVMGKFFWVIAVLKNVVSIPHPLQC